MSESRTPPISPVIVQRPSMSAVRRRLSSAAVVMSSATGQDAVLEATRQRYEDKKRRISIVSPKMLQVEKRGGENAVTAVTTTCQVPKTAFDLLSPDDATEHYRQCLRLAIENKINKKNAFDLKLIENLETLLTGKNRQNFALCASLVDVGTRIFGSRVDANDVELKRICTSLCGGGDKEGENANVDDNENEQPAQEIQSNEYGGNSSVLMEKNDKVTKKSKNQTRKVVIEDDNAKLTGPIEKRSKANPLMRGRRSALSAGGISEGLASVLLLPSLAVTENPSANGKLSTVLHYVVSEAADSRFIGWVQNIDKPASSLDQQSGESCWSFDEIEKLDLTKDLCPPLHALDLNKTFGTEGGSTNTTVDVSCEEFLKSHLISGIAEPDVEEDIRFGRSNDGDENKEEEMEDSFEMPGLEDQSIYPENAEAASVSNQDCMLLLPMENATSSFIGQAASSSMPLSSTATFSIDDLHKILAKSLATENGQVNGSGVAPSWLLEQLVNGTVGKALKMRPKKPDSDVKQAVKPRRNVVRMQKVVFGDDILKNAEERLSQKLSSRTNRKQTLATLTGENDLPEPVINQEFDNFLRKLRDCFIMGGARTSLVSLNESCNKKETAGLLEDALPVADDEFDDDEDGDGYINENQPPLFEADFNTVEKSFSRHQSLILQRNFEDNCQLVDDVLNNQEREQALSNEIPKMLLNQVRNVAGALSSFLPRRVDVRIAKTELWRSLQQNAPETKMSVATNCANDKLSVPSNSEGSTSSVATVLSPQMAFVCLLHLANEHDLILRTGENFADIQVQINQMA